MKRSSKIFSFLCLIVFSLVLFKCKKPTENIKVIINTSSLFKAPLLIHFENANSSSTTRLGDFEVKITGKDADLVQMGSGGTEFRASQGFLPLALKAAARPTSSNPLTFNVFAEIKGFAPISKTITIAKDSLLVYNISVIEFSKPADGTAVVENEVILNAGVTTSVVNFSTSTTVTLSEKVAITIPSGTQMQDENKSLINANRLKSNILLYGSSTPSLTSIFPGGLNSLKAVDKNNVSIPGGINFVTAGLFDLSLTAGTTPVLNVSKPIEVNQELENKLINFNSGLTVKAGDKIPLWSLNEETGVWKAEGDAQVVIGTAGKLMAKYTITHLAKWNLAWGWSASTASVMHTLNINLNPSMTPWVGTYDVQLQTANGNYLAGFHTYQPDKEFFQVGKLVNGMAVYTSSPGKYGFSLPYTPNITNAKVVVYDQKDKKIGESQLFNPTTLSDVNVSVSIPVPPAYVDVTANFTGQCSNRNIIAPLTAWIQIYDLTDEDHIYAYVKNGVIDNYNSTGTSSSNDTKVAGSVKLIVGHQYTISSNYNRSNYTSGVFTMAKSDFTLPSTSNNFKAATNYTESTNTLNITGTLTVECN